MDHGLRMDCSLVGWFAYLFACLFWDLMWLWWCWKRLTFFDQALCTSRPYLFACRRSCIAISRMFWSWWTQKPQGCGSPRWMSQRQLSQADEIRRCWILGQEIHLSNGSTSFRATLDLPRLGPLNIRTLLKPRYFQLYQCFLDLFYPLGLYQSGPWYFFPVFQPFLDLSFLDKTSIHTETESSLAICEASKLAVSSLLMRETYTSVVLCRDLHMFTGRSRFQT